MFCQNVDIIELETHKHVFDVIDFDKNAELAENFWDIFDDVIWGQF